MCVILSINELRIVTEKKSSIELGNHNIVIGQNDFPVRLGQMPNREGISSKVAILTQAFRESQMSDREAPEGALPSQPPVCEVPRDPRYPPTGPPAPRRSAATSQHEENTADTLPMKPTRKLQQPKAAGAVIAKVKPRAPRRDDTIDVAGPTSTEPPIQGLNQTETTGAICRLEQ